MSRAARQRRRRAHRRIQPYAWLGAGAVSVGLGIGMLGGAAVAVADTGPDSGSATASDTARGADAPRQASSTREAGPAKKAATRGGRGGAAESTQPAAAATGTDSIADRVGSALPVPAAAAATDTVVTSVEPAAPRGSADRVARPAAASAPAVEVAAPAGQPTPVADTAGAAPEAPAPAASVPGPAAVDPAPNMTSWLPATPIVPGVKVALSLQQIAQAGDVLQAGTWGSGNIFAGLAAIGPQIFLAGASVSLGAWQSNIAGAQQFLASTAGIPILQQIAQTNLLVTTWLPPIAQTSMDIAQFLLPVVGLFGAPGAVAAVTPLITAAHQNGFVYAVVPLQVKATTQPVANVSINNGSRVPLLVDTGASGVVVLPSAVPGLNSLTPVGSGESCFSGGLCYHYETYQTTVDFGGGAVTDVGLVNVVTNNEQYPDSVDDFAAFFSWGADGIIGVGANTAGPGPAPIANATLPGELNTGVLVFQNLLPFGLGGLMIFGANPLPTRVSLPGAPDAYVKVSVDGGTTKTDAGAIIDSGGVYGTLALANAPAGSVVGQNVAPGTRISVYTPDGATLLYTFTTLGGERGTPVIASGLMNTGNAPYQQNPIYMNYAGPGSGIGSTDFSIW